MELLACPLVGYSVIRRLPGPPLPRVFRNRLLAQLPARFRTRRRRALLFHLDLREVFDRVILRVEAALLQLLPLASWHSRSA